MVIKMMTSENDKSHGGLMMRLGAIAFGLGTLIYSGLEFVHFFETPFNCSRCRAVLKFKIPIILFCGRWSVLAAVNPILQMVFTFMQMYYVFMHSKLNINKNQMLAKFGLMHLIATNCCIWLRTLVKAVALLAHEKSGTFFFLWFCHFFMYLLSCSSCSCCPDYNIFERLLVLSRDRHAAVQESMREITETDEFEKLVGAGGNQIILRKYFDILAVFLAAKASQ